MRKGYSFTFSYGNRKARLVLLSILILMGSVSAFAQTITTDKGDYDPGSTAIIKGYDFGAGETVTLQVLHVGETSNDPAHLPWEVTANDSGYFSSTWTMDADAPGAIFFLTADGQSSSFHAETYFTDGATPLSITSLGTAFTDNFNAMGSSSIASITTGFKVSTNTSSPDWATGAILTSQAAGTTGTGVLTSSSAGGTYNFANGITATSTDRALGFLTSGSFSSPNSIILSFTNNTGGTITDLNISFDYEKYRSGSRAFAWTFFHGSTSNPTTSATSGDQSYAADANNTTIFNPPTSITKTVTLSGLNIPSGSSYYLKWTFTGVGGSSNGQAIGIDNFSITASGIAPPTAGIFESYAIMNFGGSDVYYDLFATTGLTDFNGANLGAFNSTQALYLDGAQNKTYKCSPPSDVLNGKLYYRIYSTSETPGSFSSAVNLPFLSNDGATGCGGQNQTWQKADAGVNLLSGLCDGSYYIEVYTTADINIGTSTANNGGTNYKATFTVKNDDRSGIFQSLLVLKINGGGDTYYDLQASTPAFDFSGSLGTFCPNGSLVVAGAENKTFKCPNNDILNKNKLFYRVYPAGSPSGVFVPLDLGFISNDAGALCAGGQNQTWRNTGGTSDILTGLLPGNYTLEVYTQASYTTNGICESIHYSNNGGANYKANFTVLAPPSFTTKPASSITFSTVSSCNAVGTYTFVTAGSTPISLSYTFSGVTTGSGSGSGTGATFNVGTTHVTVTASNACSPDAVYSFDVVVQDITPPTVVTQNVTVNLDASGNATVTAAQVNNGSNDVCGIASMSLSNSSFNCSNVLPTASDLFISEYVEGTSNIKYLEIYNGTGSNVNLANYTLRVYANGSPTVTSSNVLPAGILAAGAVVVYKNASATGYDGPATALTVMTFNGNDAVALFNNTTSQFADIIGQIGNDPGTEWGTGVVSTQDNTLRRKLSVSTGDINGADAFVPSVQWDGFATNEVSGLGAHGNVVTLSVLDNNGNTATGIAAIIVKDNLAPVVPTIADATAECSVTVTAPTATDNCGAVIGTTTDPLTYNTQGISTINWTFKDASGNTTTATQTIIVLNTTAPTPDLALLPDATGECSATIVVAPTATGNCGNTITGTTSDALTRNTQGTSVVTWTFTDPNGGTTTTQTQNIVVANTTAPTPNVASLPDATGECSATISVAPTATGNCGNTITGTTSDALTRNTQGTSVVTWTFTDPNGGTTTTQTQNIVVDDVTKPLPAVASLPVINASCSVTLTPPLATDNCTGNIEGTTPQLTFTAPGSYTVNWIYNDGNGNTETQSQTVNVVGVTVDANASSTPVAVGSDVILKATISPAIDGISIEFFVDGVSKGTATTVSGYAELNIGNQPLEVYQVVAKALPSCGESDPAYLPVYDPNGSFVTGGGWINSPAGAYTANTAATGKANFGFNSKYKKGTNIVDGSTEFQFHAGDLNFKSTLHEAGTLIITTGNRKATYRGDGTVNGVPGFKFTITAVDGHFNGGTGPDKFRIKIWNAGGVIYDNQMGVADNADDATVLSGGSIVIHQAPGKKAANTVYALADKLEIKVSNNPSMGSQPFILQFRSSDRSSDISLKVLDANGKPVELKRGVRVGQTVEVGRSFVSGLYFVEAVQGEQRVVLKLIKQ